jgi:hypothetical protein
MKFTNIPIISWELIDPDNPEKNIGHSIKIPNRCMDEMLYQHNSSEPLCVEIITMNDATNAKRRCIVSGNVEVGDEEMVVVPFWALSKLGAETFSLVSIENVTNVRKAGYIKVRATTSDYAYWDGLKETLETEFSKINNVSVGVPINVYGLEFYVMELRDVNGIRILDASLFNTDVEIDFETPTDIEEKERSDKQKLQDTEEEIRLNQATEGIETEGIETEDRELIRHKDFQGKGYKLSDNTASDNPDISDNGATLNLPAVSWKLQFHWYDGDQSKVKPFRSV